LQRGIDDIIEKGRRRLSTLVGTEAREKSLLVLLLLPKSLKIAKEYNNYQKINVFLTNFQQKKNRTEEVQQGP